jgi:hypothetical protein
VVAGPRDLGPHPLDLLVEHLPGEPQWSPAVSHRVVVSTTVLLELGLDEVVLAAVPLDEDA